jgi:hypothetical protein
MSWGLMRPWCDPPPSTADPSSPDGLRDEQLADTMTVHSRYFGDGRVQHYTDDGTLLAEYDHYRSQWSTIEPMGPTNIDQHAVTLRQNPTLTVPQAGSNGSLAEAPLDAPQLTVDRLNSAFSQYIDGSFLSSVRDFSWSTMATPASLDGQLWTVRYGEDNDVQATPRRRNKVYKIKLNVSNDEIGKAIAKHTKEKSKAISQQADVMEAQITQEEQVLTAKQRLLANAKNRIGFYKAQKERLSQSKKDLQKAFAQDIENVKQLEQIDTVALDGAGRIIITTKPISIQKSGWSEAKEAGKYQIRIDFSKSDISQGVRVLNITQRSNNHYDSPTISNTHCCWGNIAKDIERDFFSQNIEEIVLDMIEYIGSTSEQNGYLGLDGDREKGWEQFFAEPIQMAEGYNWEAYDREHPNQEGDGILVANVTGPTPTPLIERDPFSDRNAGPSREEQVRMLRNELDRLRADRDRAQHQLNMARGIPQTPEENELHFALGWLGLQEDSRGHYFELLRRNRHRVDTLRLERTDAHTYEIRATREGERDEISLDEREVTPEMLEEIQRRRNPMIVLLHNGEIEIRPEIAMRITEEPYTADAPYNRYIERIRVPGMPLRQRSPQFVDDGIMTNVPSIYNELLTHGTATLTAGSTSLSEESLRAQTNTLMQMAQDHMEREAGRDLVSQVAPETQRASREYTATELQAIVLAANAMAEEQAVDPESRLVTETVEDTTEEADPGRPRWGLIT